jgi:hypothetical protein
MVCGRHRTSFSRAGRWRVEIRRFKGAFWGHAQTKKSFPGVVEVGGGGVRGPRLGHFVCPVRSLLTIVTGIVGKELG